MTPQELWLRVGRLFEDARRKRGWKYATDVQKHSGISDKTVKRIEEGNPGTVDSLNEYAEALDLTLVDILRSALAETRKPISPEAEQVLRTFEQTNVEGRQAFLSLARALRAESVRSAPRQ